MLHRHIMNTHHTSISVVWLFLYYIYAWNDCFGVTCVSTCYHASLLVFSVRVIHLMFYHVSLLAK